MKFVSTSRSCTYVNRRQLLNARFAVASYGSATGTCSGGGGGGSGNCGNAYGNDAQCRGWASSGYCSGRYGAWMSQNCKEACGLCGGGGSNCVDSNANCPYWAGRGFCTQTYVAYMRENCKKSCNVC